MECAYSRVSRVNGHSFWRKQDYTRERTRIRAYQPVELRFWIIRVALHLLFSPECSIVTRTTGEIGGEIHGTRVGSWRGIRRSFFYQSNTIARGIEAESPAGCSPLDEASWTHERLVLERFLEGAMSFGGSSIFCFVYRRNFVGNIDSWIGTYRELGNNRV